MPKMVKSGFFKGAFFRFVFALLIVGFGFAAKPFITGLCAEDTISSDVAGKVFAGYQGWFNANGDGSPNNNWTHWVHYPDVAPAPGDNIKFDLYPDMREYPRAYRTNLGDLYNGQPATLFSSHDQSTVDVHFRWMRENGIDGAALQRFGASADPNDNWRQNRDDVAMNVKRAAQQYGVKFYVMYDISGMNASTWVNDIQSDWCRNVQGTMQLTGSSAYARHQGKPVVCIWGLGFTDRPGEPSQCLALINWFKGQNIFVIGGVPTYWREGINDSKADFYNVYVSLDMLSPWLVGRFDDAGADWFRANILEPDKFLLDQFGIVYQPTMFPGFSWANMYPGEPENQIPRLHGDFIWHQAYNMILSGITTSYIAMFDEYDEGTAIAKAAENLSMLPNNQWFLTLDYDGVAVSSDFYLRLAGDITRMMKGQMAAVPTHPTSH